MLVFISCSRLLKKQIPQLVFIGAVGTLRRPWCCALVFSLGKQKGVLIAYITGGVYCLLFPRPSRVGGLDAANRALNALARFLFNFINCAILKRLSVFYRSSRHLAEAVVLCACF